MASEQIERQLVLPAAPAEVWDALTDAAQLSEWFGAEAEMDPRRGGRVDFRFPDGRRRGAVIETFEPERLLILRWLPFEQDAGGVSHARPSTNVRFSLRARDGGTLLSVQESVPVLLPDDLSGSSDYADRFLRARAGR